MQEFLIRNVYHEWLGMTGSSNWFHRVSKFESLDLNYVLMRSNLLSNGNIMIISLHFLQWKLHIFQFEPELVYFNRLLKFSQEVFVSFCIHCITRTSEAFCCKNFYLNDLKPQYYCNEQIIEASRCKTFSMFYITFFTIGSKLINGNEMQIFIHENSQTSLDQALIKQPLPLATQKLL